MIYSLFHLLVEYLSGEAAIIEDFKGKSPTEHIYPLNLFLKPLDLGDPRAFLALKRGILRTWRWLTQNMYSSSQYLL